MTELTLIILIVLALAYFFDFTNGWNDSANAIATVVSTKVLSPFTAVILAALLNIAGAFFSTAVAKTIGGKILDVESITQLVVAGALVAGITWNVAMTVMGLPISASHALFGGLLGAGFAHGGLGVIKWSGVELTLLGLFLSPIFGLGLGFLFMTSLNRLFQNKSYGAVQSIFGKLQILSVSLMAFTHGTNDAQKAMGVITLALVAGGYLTSFDVPFWVILSCGLVMGLGTAFGGWRVIRTMGMRILKLRPIHGFAAETSAAVILFITATMGVPVSTTHTITSTIMGVGASRRLSAVRWGVGKKIIYAWIFTFPGTMLVGYLTTLLLGKI